MRYVDGDDLRTLVRREGHLHPARAARLVARSRRPRRRPRAWHRPSRRKPANVLLGPGDHAYLTDFGLARRLDSARG
jgi:serine/threonine-protein kinase